MIKTLNILKVVLGKMYASLVCIISEKGQNSVYKNKDWVNAFVYVK